MKKWIVLFEAFKIVRPYLEAKYRAVKKYGWRKGLTHKEEN